MVTGTQKKTAAAILFADKVNFKLRLRENPRDNTHKYINDKYQCT